MWPWAHLGFGYLLYRGLVAVRGRPVDGVSVIALAVGTQFPDLVDKPLAWYLAVLPSGRSLAHSLLALVVVTGLVALAGRRLGRDVGWRAFGLGYLSHLVGDGYHHVLTGDYALLTFLLYPLTPSPDYGVEPGLLYRLATLDVEPTLLGGFAITLLALGLWVSDGGPGLAELRRLAGRLPTERVQRPD